MKWPNHPGADCDCPTCAERKVRFDWLMGTVDVSNWPPAATLEGLPALPGENWRDYTRRAAAHLGVRMP